MAKRAPILFIAAVLLAAGRVPSYAASAGTTAADFLKIPVAAIPSGMGEAYTAMVGPDSILYNPAGLGLLSYSALSASYNQYILGVNQGYLSLSWRFPFGTLGAAYSALSSGQIDAYDQNDMPIGKASTSHRFAGLSFAQSWPHYPQDAGKLDPMLITPPWTRIEPVRDYRPKVYRFSAGATVKQISEDLAGTSSSAMAFDAGVLLVLPHHLQLGASAMNFGSAQKFEESSAQLPSSLRAGLAKDFHTVDDIMIFTVASDLVKYRDQNYISDTGLQVDIMRLFQLRLGYTSLKDAGSKVSGGFGLNFDSVSDKGSLLGGTRIDYSYVGYGELGATHRFGFQMVW